jgi:hypothetical protein
MPAYEFINDPGHGWLKVPLSDLPKDLEFSEYSFFDDEFAYLEEDCDAGLFLQHIEVADSGYSIEEKYVDSFDRNKARFPR